MSGNQCQCTGWWEQMGYGRQNMSGLLLEFNERQIVGSGTDVVGPFVLKGRLEDGKVRLNKQYFEKHTVVYQGHYDGEGTLHGRWVLGFDQGKWLIRIERADHNARNLELNEIPEFEPA